MFKSLIRMVFPKKYRYSYNFNATVLCPNGVFKEYNIRHWFKCTFETDQCVPFGEIFTYVEKYVGQAMFIEKFACEIKNDLPKGRLTVTAEAFGASNRTVLED